MNLEDLIKELQFKAIRSSGAGGQHVNKVSSKIELKFNVLESLTLSEIQKEVILKNLKSKLTKDKYLVLFCDDSRSQHQNKTLVIQRFINLIEAALKTKKKRIATKIPKAVVNKRLDDKKKNSGKKANRKKPDLE